KKRSSFAIGVGREASSRSWSGAHWPFPEQQAVVERYRVWCRFGQPSTSMCCGANKRFVLLAVLLYWAASPAATQVVGASVRCAKHLLGPAAVRLTAIRPRSTGTSIVNSAWRAANGCGPIAGNYEATSTSSAKSAEPTAPLCLLLQFAFPASKAWRQFPLA